MKKNLLIMGGTAFLILAMSVQVIAQPQPGESGAGLPTPLEMPTPPSAGQFSRFGESENEGNDQQRQQFRQKMLERFDANHDGQMDDNERAKMREFMQQRRMREQQNSGGQGGPRPQGFGQQGFGQQQDGQQGSQMQEMAERRQKMLERFDANHDGQLDDSERAQMREFMQQRRMMHEQREQQHEGPAGDKSGPGTAIN